MPGEANHFAVVLERIARHALAQFRDISDVDLNCPLELPESNTAFVLATHLIGSAEYWVLELAGGRDVQRDRLSEFRATGTAADLAVRYERWLAAMQEVLDALPDERLDQPVNVPARYHPSLEEDTMTLRDALITRRRTLCPAPGPPGVDPATAWLSAGRSAVNQAPAYPYLTRVPVRRSFRTVRCWPV